MASTVVGVHIPFELDSDVLRFSFITLTQVLWGTANNNPKHVHLNNVTGPRGSSATGKATYISLTDFFHIWNSINVLNHFYTGEVTWMMSCLALTISTQKPIFMKHKSLILWYSCLSSKCGYNFWMTLNFLMYSSGTHACMHTHSQDSSQTPGNSTKQKGISWK